MDASELAKPLLILSTIAALSFGPAPTPGGPSDAAASIGVSDACASGTCCPQASSKCITSGMVFNDYFYQSSGAC